MHAEIGDAPFNQPDWMWEPKLDGYRVLAFIDEHGVKLRSRRGLELAADFPAARRGARASRRVNGMILDGEIVAFDASGKPSFNALQNRVQLKTEREIAAADQSTPGGLLLLRPAAFRRRRPAQGAVPRPAALPRAMPAAFAAGAARARADDGVALHAAALASGFEGVIGKRKDSTLRGRQALGVVAEGQADAAAPSSSSAATRKGKGSRAPLGALLVGYWDREQAALRLARRLGLRRAHAGAGARRGWSRCSARPARSPRSPS